MVTPFSRHAETSGATALSEASLPVVPPPLPRDEIARRFNVVIAALMVATTLVIGMYWWSLERSLSQLRAATLADATEHALSLAQAVGGRMQSTVRSVDIALDYLRKLPPPGNAEFDAEARGAAATFPAGALLQIAVVGTDGRLAFSTLKDWKPVYLGDREHFTVHQGDAPDQLFISRPLLGRTSGVWTVQFSRRIERAGRFGGVIVLSMSPRYLSRELAELGLHDNDVATLMRADGSILARSLDDEGNYGRSAARDRPYMAADAAPTGSFRAPSNADGVPRIYAWRRLPETGLIALVGLSEARIMATVDAGVASSHERGAAITLLLAAMAVALGALLWRLKRQQIALADNAQLYRNLFERNLSVKLFVDPETGAITEANAAACRFYGYSHEQLLAMRIDQINMTTPEQLARELDDARRERRGHFRFRHRLASGQIRDVEVYSGPVERDGRTLLYSIIHDVTERRRLEDRLRASEMRHRNMFEVLAEGVLVVDADGALVSSNAAARTLLNADDAALSARRYALVDRNDQPLAAADYPTQHCLDAYSSQSLVGVVLPGGARRWLAVNTRRLPAELDGHIPGAVVSFSDVTRVIAMEQEARTLTEARIAAEDASRAKSDFLSNMSHEFRTPMNAVLGLLRRTLATRLDVRQRDLLTNALGAAGALTNLLDDLLDLSTIESGLFVVERRPFSLDVVLDGASNVIAPICRQKGLEFRIRRAADVPDALVGDPVRLGQVLTNLLGNAVKFTERGGVSLLCECAPADASDRVNLRFVVIDTGIGMNDSTVEQLFRTFVQADSSSTRRHGGIGLGLSITRQLLHRMDGRIDVASAPGLGATFTVTIGFGRADASQLAAPVAAALPPAPPRETVLAGRRVLLVEDNPLNQLVAAEMLRDKGVLVDLARDGAEALQRLAATEYDAVLMDVQMPVMDGYEATRELRRNPRLAQLPVIALTANAMIGDRERCLAAGMNDYLAKPVAPEALYAALRSQLARATVSSGADAG